MAHAVQGQRSLPLTAGDTMATGTSIGRALRLRSLQNSPAKSKGGLVNNNEKYKLASFRKQRQRPPPRRVENNNEYQAENKRQGHGQEHLCLTASPDRATTCTK
jgi:hypothetical protein